MLKRRSSKERTARERSHPWVKNPVLDAMRALKITAVYAHNDDMALGAIQAIEAYGKQPGKDILLVSIDGVKGAFEAMVAGKLNATVECNPLLGPLAFDAVVKAKKGEALPKWTKQVDQTFTAASPSPSSSSSSASSSGCWGRSRAAPSSHAGEPIGLLRRPPRGESDAPNQSKVFDSPERVRQECGGVRPFVCVFSFVLDFE
jgi:hypothetical protein